MVFSLIINLRIDFDEKTGLLYYVDEIHINIII